MKELKNLISIAILCSFLSCNNIKREYYKNSGNIKKEYYVVDGKKNGLYKEFYEDGKIKYIHKFRNGEKIDSSMYFRNEPSDNSLIWKKKYLKNGKIFMIFFYKKSLKKAEGEVLNSLKRIGEWKFYREDGTLLRKSEYFNINGEEFLNQYWNFNEKGKLEFTEGNYYESIISNDTVYVDESVSVLFNLKRPAFSYDSKFYAILIGKNQEIKDDFSNFEVVEKDTILSLSNLGGDYKKYNFSVAFNIKYSNTGLKRLKGVLVEEIDEKINRDDIIFKKKQRKIFFDKKILVIKNDLIDNGTD